MDSNIINLRLDFPYVLKDQDYFSRLKIPNTGMGHFNLDSSEIIDSYLSWLNSNNLEIKLAEIFYCAPHSEIPVHSDEFKDVQCCKMNWAYCDTEVPMNWYKLEENTKLDYKYTTIGSYYLTCDLEHYILEQSAVIKNPSLVQVTKLHGVVNNTNDHWWCVSIVLKNKNSTEHRISWSQAIDILKEYIDE